MGFWEVAKEILEEAADTRRRTAEYLRAVEETEAEVVRRLEMSRSLIKEVRERMIISHQIIRSSHKLVRRKRSGIKLPG